MIERRPPTRALPGGDFVRHPAGAAELPGLPAAAELDSALKGLRSILNAMEFEGGGERAGADMLAFARRLISERYRRYHFFDGHLFSDPAWDIMLELFVAELEEREVPVTNLCFTSNVPDTTVLRWIKTLTNEGLLERNRDEVDKRRVLVRLSRGASETMHRYIKEQIAGAEKARPGADADRESQRRRST